MTKQGLWGPARSAALAVAGLAVLLTMQPADRPPAPAGPATASPTLTLDLKLDLGAAGAALRLSL